MKRFVGDPDEGGLPDGALADHVRRERADAAARDPGRERPARRQGRVGSDGREAPRHSGATVEYVVFDDEGHGFTKRENELRAMRLSADWLERHLLAG